jgi:hypothetical protein
MTSALTGMHIMASKPMTQDVLLTKAFMSSPFPSLPVDPRKRGCDRIGSNAAAVVCLRGDGAGGQSAIS